MTDTNLLELIAALPAGAKLTITVDRDELETALVTRGGVPEKLVGTVFLADTLGMTREWWADQAPKIEGAVRETPTSPWWVPMGAARAYLESYWLARRGLAEDTSPRSRHRAPWKGRAQ